MILLLFLLLVSSVPCAFSSELSQDSLSKVSNDKKEMKSKVSSDIVKRYSPYTVKSRSTYGSKNKLKDAVREEEFTCIHDEYSAKRGAPKMLAVFCKTCDGRVMSYQKDGPGRLLRCYLDRIKSSESLSLGSIESFNVRTAPTLKCSKCSTIIGYPMIYKPESRPAYRMASSHFYFKAL